MLDELSGRVALPLGGDVEAHSALASQSLAAGVIARVAAGDVGHKADVVERVGEGLHAVLGSLTLPGLPAASATATLEKSSPTEPGLR